MTFITTVLAVMVGLSINSILDGIITAIVSIVKERKKHETKETNEKRPPKDSL